jgi:hypothetical protein
VLLGILSFHEQKFDEAWNFLARGLALGHELRYGWLEANALAGCACVAAATGQAERAARLGAAAERLARTLAVTIVPDHRMALDAALTHARQVLGDTGFATAWTTGDAMPTDLAVADVLDETKTQDASP